MATKAELLTLNNHTINTLADKITSLQKESMRLYADGQLDQCRSRLKKQQEAIGALSALIMATQEVQSWSDD